jgi:hypothetical protein
VEAGAEVEVVLAPEGPQADALAADILAALDSELEARAFFESLATFYRNGYVRWIEGAKRPETRSARIAEMLGLLKIAAGAGYVQVYLSVAPIANPRAYALYQRLGYQQLQAEPYRKIWEFTDSEGQMHRGEDWVVDMVKQLQG